ncbi:pentatricopeptide repeat-containing protein At3g02330, mitochondrial-like [Curcuma longa]|uniref:pentatricopeptide repeat-containing protein At3g02330, mitochondrial-like n=1 Tax=Curcuma longa TaxID=136217 RepID=UPI003D9ED921
MRLPSSTSYSWIASGIKSALAQNSLFGGKCFHAHVIKIGYLHDIFLCNHLLNFYAKSYSVSDANALFDEIDEPNLVSYSTLISANSKLGNPSFGLHLLSELHRSQIELNPFIFSASVVACSKLKDLGLGQQIHAQAVVSGRATDSFVNTALVDMYSKLGDLAGATTLFYQCPSEDPVMFNAMLSGYVSHGECEQAIWVFKQARKRFNLKVSEFCFASITKACSDLERGIGEQLHGLIIKMGFDSNCFVRTSLVDMYSRFGDTESMEMVLQGTKSCDIALYNATIGGFSRNGLDKIALDYFMDMMLEGFLPNDCTLSSVLKACGSLKSLDSGRVIHGIVEKSRFRQDVVVNTALIDMYAKCGSIEESCLVFGYMHERNTVSYNSLIFGHGLNGNDREAISLFNDMNNNNIDVDLATFVALLSSCCGHEWVTYVHAIKHGFASELMVNDALLHCLCKNGTVDQALEFFNKMEYQNVISWTIMISGLTMSGQYLDAIHFFKTMISSDISPNSFTFSCVLKACGHLSCPKGGGCFHAQCIKHGTMDHYTKSSLVDMYAKCGSLKESRRLFDQHRDKDIVLWNTMVAGYAQHGYGLEALELYTLMGKNNIHPNHVTFVSFLSACSHCGLVDEGIQIFDLMVSKHGIMPSMEHYACMVDLFGRSGKLDRAKRLILDMPFEADVSIWATFLSACKLHGNLELAESTTDKVMKMHGELVPTAVLISNLYSELGRPDDAEYMRKLAGPRMRKEPGLSWIT